ncbi:MAG: hypothetical protein GWN00_25740, partial [Aliifodinibius sp.]|nr:hypothetical protein [Fodinibius sp.]NIV14244.1 hypothetical protein [Fodinibius sp.]NIY28078.1 hypothetical protein [Fodinibius sp.]
KMFNYNLKLNHEFSSTSLLELSFDGYNEPDVDLPGGLSPTGFEEDFRQSEHPNDFFDGYRYGGNIKFYKQINANQRLRILGYGHKAFRNFGLDRSGGTVIRETPRKFWVYAFEPQYSVKF